MKKKIILELNANFFHFPTNMYKYIGQHNPRRSTYYYFCFVRRIIHLFARIVLVISQLIERFVRLVVDMLRVQISTKPRMSGAHERSTICQFQLFAMWMRNVCVKPKKGESERENIGKFPSVYANTFLMFSWSSFSLYREKKNKIYR